MASLRQVSLIESTYRQLISQKRNLSACFLHLKLSFKAGKSCPVQKMLDGLFWVIVSSAAEEQQISSALLILI